LEKRNPTPFKIKSKRIFGRQVSSEVCHAVSYKLDAKGVALLLLKIKIQEQEKKPHKTERVTFWQL